jgi:hypothetical protein
MKTQRRHELQTNELADHLGKYLKTIRPYQNYIFFGIVAVVAVISAAVWMNNQQRAKASASWTDYFGALGGDRAETLEDVAKFHQGSTAALWAQLSAGDRQLFSGSDQMFQDRDQAEKTLKDAEKNFKAVESAATKYPDLVQRARFGLAQVYEAMCDVEKARDRYEQVAEAGRESAIGKLAERRFKRLSQTSVEGWYAWFERQEPVVPGGPGTASGPGMGPLGDLEDLPDRPDLSFPSDSLLNEPLSTEDPPTAPSASGDEEPDPADDAPEESADVPEQPMDEDAAGEAVDAEAAEEEAAESSDEGPPESPIGDEADSSP